jgi:hypothetical protein
MPQSPWAERRLSSLIDSSSRHVGTVAVRGAKRSRRLHGAAVTFLKRERSPTENLPCVGFISMDTLHQLAVLIPAPAVSVRSGQGDHSGRVGTSSCSVMAEDSQAAAAAMRFPHGLKASRATCESDWPTQERLPPLDSVLPAPDQVHWGVRRLDGGSQSARSSFI